ncbi:MAG: hypothetical protein BGN90_14980 [Acidovorax sp. 65-7]|nr:MAG: hypothetical protein BGN90_14980 [Acidovorax sp. 65-7]
MGLCQRAALLQSTGQVMGQGQSVGRRRGRTARAGAPRPVDMCAVEHQAHAATGGFKVVPVARGDHAAATGRHAHATARHLQVQRSGESQQNLEMVMAVAARRGAVVSQREQTIRAHGRP